MSEPDQPEYNAENITLWLFGQGNRHSLVARGRGITGIAAVLVAGPAACLAAAAAAAVAVVLPPQCRKPLLLGVCVDVGSNYEADDVEEGYPGGLGQELLGERQRDGGDDPADLHDGHEAGLDGCADLVECAGAGNQSHGGQVDAVLDGRDLGGLARRTISKLGCDCVQSGC